MWGRWKGFCWKMEICRIRIAILPAPHSDIASTLPHLPATDSRSPTRCIPHLQHTCRKNHPTLIYTYLTSPDYTYPPSLALSLLSRLRLSLQHNCTALFEKKKEARLCTVRHIPPLEDMLLTHKTRNDPNSDAFPTIQLLILGMPLISLPNTNRKDSPLTKPAVQQYVESPSQLLWRPASPMPG